MKREELGSLEYCLFYVAILTGIIVKITAKRLHDSLELAYTVRSCASDWARYAISVDFALFEFAFSACILVTGRGQRAGSLVASCGGVFAKSPTYADLVCVAVLMLSSRCVPKCARVHIRVISWEVLISLAG